MSSIKVIFLSLPVSELEFQQNLKSALKDNQNNFRGSSIEEIQQSNIDQAVIGPNHFAFLTAEGHVCRIGYSMNPTVFGKEKKENEKKSETAGSINQQYDVFFAARRAGLCVARQRGRNLIASNRVRTAKHGGVDDSITVPEDRILQCQAVLAGKSRDIIKQELQRTHLDVNMAINNILSRDEGEDPGAGASLGTLISTFSHSDELFNLIDDPDRSGLLDDILGKRRLLKRQGKTARDSKLFADKQPMKLPSPEQSQGDIHYDITEWWPLSDTSIKFVSIVSLHSELLALDSNGRLHQWSWNKALSYFSTTHPGVYFHPKTESLNLTNEEVSQISGSVCRASFITKSNKIGTLCDQSIEPFAKYFEQSALLYPDLAALNISQHGQLRTCSQWTILQVKNELYWWGILPFEQRLKCQEKTRKVVSESDEDLKVGSTVIMKKQPVYGHGTKGLLFFGNEPKVGELVHDVHKIEDKCVEFKILKMSNAFEKKRENRKRKYEEMEKGGSETEKWNLKKVLFFPDNKEKIQGTIVRIDDQICAVSFGGDNDNLVTNQKIRLVMKDDICPSNKSSRIVDIVQKVPRKLSIAQGLKVLASDVDEEGWIHLILNNQNIRKIQYGKYDISKQDTSHVFSLPTTIQSFQNKKQTPLLNRTFSDCPLILLDALKVYHPLLFNQGKILQDPEWFWLGLPPVQDLASSIHIAPPLMDSQINKAFVALVVLKRQILIPILLQNIPELLKILLEVLTEEYEQFENVVEAVYEEILDGQRNIIHACIDGSARGDESATHNHLAFVIDNVEALHGTTVARRLHGCILGKLSENSQRTTVIRKPNGNIMNQNSFKWTEGQWKQSEVYDPDSESALVPRFQHCKESTLSIILNSTLIGVQLNNLLKSKDSFGRTPFMYSVHKRSYFNANYIFQKALQLANETNEPEVELLKYIYPPGSPFDLNPLYVLCCNDTCSFTWTKDKHINQDIYECRTCGLTDTLCCCSECARTCHADHDCVLKKTSPTAYCDCLEKCPCRSQEEGNQKERSDLLESILTHSSLVEIYTSKGEHLLQFLAQTVSRQVKEQTQGKETIDSSRSRSKLNEINSADSSNTTGTGALNPPTFCRKALTRVLRDWRGVRSLVMNTSDQLCASYYSSKQSVEEQQILDNQCGSIRLDKFTHTLLLKLMASEYLDSLIGTIKSYHDDSLVSERFVRSVVRVFTCFTAGLQPVAMNSEKQSEYIERCKRVFRSLPIHSIKQLCLSAESLLQPIRFGVVKPVETFTLSQDVDEVIQSTEELFSAAPMGPKKEKKNWRRRNRNSVRQSERDDFEEADSETELRGLENISETRTTRSTHTTPVLDPVSNYVSNLLSQPDHVFCNEENIDENQADQETDGGILNDGDVPMMSENNEVPQLDSVDELEADTYVDERTDGIHNLDQELDQQVFEDDQDIHGNNPDDMDVQSSVYTDDDSINDFNGEGYELSEEIARETDRPASRGQTLGSSSRSQNRNDPYNMNWAVREMPLDRSTRRYQRWLRLFSENNQTPAADYINLTQNESSLNRKRGTLPTSKTCSFTESQAKLARSASLCVKEVGELLKSGVFENIKQSERIAVSDSIENILMPTWNWVLTVMDWTESQLRYGSALHSAGEQSRDTKFDSKKSTRHRQSRQSHDFLTYTLSLLRQGSSEHADILPSIDISSLKHIAFVLDAMIFLVKQDLSVWFVENQAKKDLKFWGQRNVFFRRSESMLFMGFNDEESFDLTYAESLPLSEQPHLLKPDATKEEMFGRATNKLSVNFPTSMHFLKTHELSKPGYLTGVNGKKVEADSLLYRWRKTVELFAPVFMDDVGSEDGSILRQLASFSLRKQKFQKQMEILRQSVKQGELKIEVNRAREKLIPQTIKKLNLEYQKVKEDKGRKYDNFSSGRGDAFGENPITSNPISLIKVSGLLVARKIKVRFIDEPGEGNGVMRSFFTTIADCFLSSEKLPDIGCFHSESTLLSPKNLSEMRRSGLSGLSRLGRSQRWDKAAMNVNAEEWTPEGNRGDSKYSLKEKVHKIAISEFPANGAKITGMFDSLTSGQLMNCMNDEEQMKLKILEAQKLLKDAKMWKISNPESGGPDESTTDEQKDNLPLFYLPNSNQRYYAVEPGRESIERLNIFRNVGRIIGLSLLHNELCPIPLTRSVVKQILGRKVNWYDLAFYDTELFESLRKIIQANKNDPTYLENLDMTFELVDSVGTNVELITGGASLKVTSENIYDYIRRYAMYKMVQKPEKTIRQIRRGVHDVISETALNGLTPEDWWLLVNGVGTVDVSKLSSITTFNDESSSNSDVNNILGFQKCFWEVVETFTQSERQELLYFWTGAPALRAGEEAFEPAPSVTIRHPNDEALPSANTCISRLYLPLYSTKTILKTKLSMAIKTKTFGFV